MNVVTLIGRLASDVDLRELGDGRKVATFLLAVDRSGSEGKADFIRIATWNRQADLCASYLAMGKRVAIDGRLRSRSWEGADGKRRSAVEVTAGTVQFLSPRERSSGEAESTEEAAVAS